MRDIATSAVLAATVALFVPAAHAVPVGTAFTYQGSLRDGGAPAQGTFDLEFTLYDDAAGAARCCPPWWSRTSRSSWACSRSRSTSGPARSGGRALAGDRRAAGASTGAFTAIAGRQELQPAPNALAAPWTGVHGKPAGFADDLDDDALAALACANGQIPERNGSAWTCAADDDALAVLPCASGQIPERNGSTWTCAADDDALAVAPGRSSATEPPGLCGRRRPLAPSPARTGRSPSAAEPPGSARRTRTAAATSPASPPGPA